MSDAAGPHMIELIRVSETERPALFELVDQYLLELAAHREVQVGPTSAAEDQYLPAYWSERGRHPFFINAGGQRAGFLLVREVLDEGVIHMSEFFIQQEFRRSGVGRAALREVWRRLPGSWELQVHSLNGPASEFWPRCIEALCEGPVRTTEVTEEDGRRIQYNFETVAAEQGVAAGNQQLS